MGDVGVGDGFAGVGEKWVIPPDPEQGIGVAGVFDAAHDQPRGHRGVGGGKRGVAGFGDFGIGDLGSGFGIADCSGVAHRRPRIVVDRRNGCCHGDVFGQHQ